MPDLVASVLFAVLSVIIIYGGRRAMRWLEVHETRQIAAETWPVLEPADDLERWLLQRNGETLGEFLEKVARDQEVVAQRAQTIEIQTHGGRVDVFGQPRLGGALAAAGHPVHGTARHWVTGEMEVYCLACNAWVAAGAALEHVHPMEGTA